LIGGRAGNGAIWPHLVQVRVPTERQCGMDLYTAMAGRLNFLDAIESLVRGLLAGDVVGHQISVPYPTSSWWDENNVPFWNMGDVKRLLAGYHVYTYAHGFNESIIWTHVKQDQARWTEYVLLRAGCPMLMDTVDERNIGWAANPAHDGKMPARWDDREKHVAPDWGDD